MKLWKWFLLMTLALITFGCANPLLSLQSPKVTLSDLRLQSISVFEQRYAVGLRIQNPNAEALPIRGMQFTLYVNHAELAHGVTREEITLPAYGEQLVKVDVVSSLGNIMEQISSLEKKSVTGIQYKVVGSASVTGFTATLPFEYTGEFVPPK